MKQLLIIILLFSSAMIAHAQHDHGHHHQPGNADTAKRKSNTSKILKADTLRRKANRASAHQADTATGKSPHGHSSTNENHGQHPPMSHAFSRNLPMTRNGSGTSWLPDNTPMYGYMFHSKQWMYMVHGNVFLRYNSQDMLNKGSRGGKKFDAPNMVMLMGQRNVGKKGLFHFNTMFSLDPLTVGEEGYPLLFQTGETYNGQPLVDRQHPHDFISELSASYAHALSPSSDVFVYLGYPGEPAIGPSAFVHRPSGFFNPDAPLTHHWIDATHITFGVATVGFRFGNWKIETSSFTGREPDENRYDFDAPRFDSWSGRLSFNPTEKWALQISRAFIKEPEQLHPGENVKRTTASATFSTRGYGETFTNITGLWGVNKSGGHEGEHAILIEGSHTTGRTTVYGRYEFVEKSAEELNLNESDFHHDAIFPVHALTAGASYDIARIGQTRLSLGGQLSFYNPERTVSSLYGDNPLAGQVYIRLYPGAMGRRSGSFVLPY
jgi:hypothetical protein